MASELTKARISRGVCKSHSDRANKRLSNCLKELEEQDPCDISVEQMGGLEVFVQKAQDSLTKYEESVVRCLGLEEIKVEKQSEDDNFLQMVDLEEEVEGLNYRVGGQKGESEFHETFRQSIASKYPP